MVEIRNYQPKSPIKTNINGHWLFPERLGVAPYCGFVYVIRDPIIGRFYLGKKFFHKKSKSGAFAETSDWKKYVSSSKTLAKMFEHRPKEEFEFIVLEQYKARGAVSYSETWSLCHVNAPLFPDIWYNQRIEEVKWVVREHVTDRHIQRLHDIIDMKDFKSEAM
jgi:hypothetical protein